MIGSDAMKRHIHVRDRQHLVLTRAHDLTRYMLRALRNLRCVWLLELLRRGRPREENESQNLKC